MSLKELIKAELDLMSEKKLENIYQIIKKINEEEMDKVSDWDRLSHVLDECKIDTGIEDLAYQHDHYIHGSPKRDEE